MKMTPETKQNEIFELSFEALDTVVGGSTKQLLEEYDALIAATKLVGNVVQFFKSLF
jgi:small basic protein